jgi:excisionase family DNA binding protein
MASSISTDRLPALGAEERLFVRPAKAAVLLDVSRSRIYELLGAGVIPCVRFDNGRTIRIPMAALSRLVEDAVRKSGDDIERGDER